MKKPSSTKPLSQQYGGRHSAGWVDMLPESWIPFVQLARLSPPVGFCLVLFPHVFGFLHAILLLKAPVALQSPSSSSFSSLASASFRLPSFAPAWPNSTISITALSRDPSTLYLNITWSLYEPVRTAALLLAGSFFLSNAIHGWNDLIDAPYDALIERTRGRPIVRGAISKNGALLFTFSQVLLSMSLLTMIWIDLDWALYYTWPSVLANLYYPWAKRHTYFAQSVLGLCLGWGVVVGTASVLEVAQEGQEGELVWGRERWTSTLSLTGVVVLWTIIYDTIYACQDKQDDTRIGLKSTAVLFGRWVKAFLVVNLGLMTALLAYIGYLNECGGYYYAFAVGGCLLSLGMMIANVDLEDSFSCWWWFRYGFWLAGGSIAMALLLECVVRSDIAAYRLRISFQY